MQYRADDVAIILYSLEIFTCCIYTRKNNLYSSCFISILSYLENKLFKNVKKN